MLPKKSRSTEELLHALEEEQRARQRAVAEAESQRRLLRALDQLAKAAGRGDDLERLLQDLLEIFVDATQVDMAVLRLREGERLRSRAAVGLEDEVAAGFSLPIGQGFAGKLAADRLPLLLELAEADELCESEFFRKQGVRALYGLPLLDGEQLLGVVCMGTLAARGISEDHKQLLSVLGTCATGVIARHMTHANLQQSIRSRDDVLAVVAHDLRNPLNIISLSAITLLQRLPDSSDRRSVERIVRGVQRADRLVRDLLEINAMETGRFAISRQRVEPADVILTALESQQGLAAEASVIICTDLSPELPTIEADEERLLEVLENLVSNAVKFTKAGGSITVGATHREGEILLWVKDSGSGIAPEHLEHIFDRFWQASRADRRGTGLGLTICKGIVEAHGGRIWAESTPGQGTTVIFTIPAAQTGAGASADIEVADILLVDDRPENLLSLQAILGRPDYRLVTAASGAEALGLALRERFCLALIDIAMPRMSGLEVAVHLKELERSRDIPIIFITAFGSDPEEIHRAYSAGGVDYLVKPLDAEIVRKKVAVFVDLYRRRHGNQRRRGETSSRSE